MQSDSWPDRHYAGGLGVPQEQLLNLLNLSIGNHAPDRRLSASAYTETVDLKGTPVRIEISADAVRAAADSRVPIVAALEPLPRRPMGRRIRMCAQRSVALTLPR
jgi:hypothetical protein